MAYITVDQVAARAISLGKGSLLAKIDIKSAYRLIPICPRDRLRLGMQWNNLAEGLEWCIFKEGMQHIFHYLDDFIVLGPAESSECGESLHALKQISSELSIPLAEEKQDGTTSVITFLGIIIDTDRRELRLPVNKLQRLMEEIHQWLQWRSCTRRELESLIRVMQHACKVIIPGRLFLRRAITHLSVAKKKYHHIRFATHWNGASLIVNQDSPEAVVTSDASGFWGCGAWHDRQWFQLEWDERTVNWHIAAKELVPIIMAAVLWGQKWKGNRVVARCDNTAVVTVLNSRYAKDVVLMRMLSCLFFVEAHF